jgi:hypothetical protein
MYIIIDLTQNPPTAVPDLEFETIGECAAWIDANGGECPVCVYTCIEKP